MAASAKRKQEEKHLKMLREMTSLPANRKCFDCDQRGPTYANMTVGSFVCTSCSGILRGLNPPNRVKSISMTTFTQQEIEFLQRHGNEVCRQIWLGLYDGKTTSLADFREPQKAKEFLQEKYEKKRWYVPPEQAKVVASVHASVSGSSNSSNSSTPEVRPLKSLLGDSAPTLHLNKNTPPNQSPVTSRGQTHQQHDKKFDLLSDLGGDIFAGPPKMNAGAGSGFANFAHFNSHTTAQNSNTNADFANFDAFGSTPGSMCGFPSAPQAPFQASNAGGTTIPPGVPQNHRALGPGGDRYAALAELDTVFGPPAPSSVYNNNSSSTQGAAFSSEPGVSTAQAQQVLPGMAQGFGAQSSNPFVAAGVATAPAPAPANPFQINSRVASVAAAAAFGTASLSMPAGFGNAAAYNLPTSFSGTFQQPFPGQGPFSQPPPYPQQTNGGGFSVFGQGKPVGTPFGQAMAAPMMSSNPFLGAGPTAQYPTGGSSTNPFL
ncbi:arf-GAP domain and FG repeat-containing protein 1-like isoform X1 [Entelurus aequoreus]|uniref:arf-GAP domain and FG repeat-containing protein 1-like isoform X1 n=1 Tax=Entelurus aequoreus TaxID=161455 RepID=UPI002B1D4AD6|nr:arf-GAP domain and FG repeat-containing protein 1-like isoform X1 [Entelurus aequoreus]XP_061924312.1 arf-GAP domain and FG repeat-containing protein 1-like isoform X1 [Entelurus aequoreus]XP_061924333.1 arf-GAP domain and FG repeat-containing protein 1-like isoform X1 [Entelurus aequoreus]XP_061924334.1 arf-GAP domain and FG repeat-containing protein 1-like isoform X1 [Entelurus aequoreus]